MHAFFRECRHYIELLFIPSMAIFMPWWLAMRFFRAVASFPFLYRELAEMNAEGASTFDLLGADEKGWKKSCKVGYIVDFADVFLLLVGRKSYWQHYVDDNFSKHVCEQQIVFTPHYGAGTWVLWYLQSQGIQSVFFANLPDKSLKAEQLIARLRLYVLRKLNIITLSRESKSELRRLIENGATIVVLPDMPAECGLKFYQPKTSLGKLNLLSFFFDLAEKTKLPILVTTFGLDVVTGRRDYEAVQYHNQGAEQYAQAFAEQAAIVIKEKPYLWRMLPVAPQVLFPVEP